MQHSVVETWVFVFNKSFKSSQGSWGGRGQLRATLELLQPVGLGERGAQFGASRAERGVEGPNLWGKDSVGVSGDSTSPGTILPWGCSSGLYPGAEARGCPGHPQPYLAGPPCASAAPWWLQGGSTCSTPSAHPGCSKPALGIHGGKGCTPGGNRPLMSPSPGPTKEGHSGTRAQEYKSH